MVTPRRVTEEVDHPAEKDAPRSDDLACMVEKADEGLQLSCFPVTPCLKGHLQVIGEKVNGSDNGVQFYP